MHRISFPAVVAAIASFVAAAATPAAAHAQAAPPRHAPDHRPPATAASPTAKPERAASAAPPRAAAQRQRSAFDGYRGFRADEPAVDWRDANELAARIGGWRAYARETQSALEGEP